jgi:hypothetical protein
LLLVSLGSSAQFGYFKRLERKQEKYFVGLGYGVGTAHWRSNLDNSQLYDKFGAVIQSGYIRFKAKNSTEFLDLTVQFPLAKIRLGMGINFEKYFLDKLEITASPGADAKVILFDESFRFEKFFGIIEVPFWPESKSDFSLSGNSRLGYFGYSGVERLNFFGEESLAKTYFGNLGFIADYRFYPHAYVFVNPSFEYKYFKNSPQENPSIIRHNIFSYMISAGVRVDVSRE